MKLGLILLTSLFLLSSCSDSKTSSSVSKSKLSSPESSEQVTVVSDEGENTDSKNPQQNAAKIQVLSPNGHEYLIKGKTASIKWKKGNGGKFVTISLLRGGKAYKTVVKKTKNDGAHSWKIPKSIRSGDSYKIKVSSFTAKTVFDLSNFSFAIQNPDTGDGTGGVWIDAPEDFDPPVTGPAVTSPSEGERWLVGRQHIIKWTRTGSPYFKHVRIALKTGPYPGDHVTVIYLGWDFPNGSYPWSSESLQSERPCTNRSDYFI
ncbi:MAG: Ser-Thr-rich GPI-anchored membrane family protein, partial [Arenicellales bacterium]|nr:Ser-Thr-rich GPI-anchored membrane family protein [Arenicellales bacterium]